MVPISTKRPVAKKPVLIILLILATFFQSLPLIRSGLMYDYGLAFWGPSGHDMIWHLALSQQAQNPLSIVHPTYSGETLQNYHPFYNILVNFFHQLTNIDYSLITFQVFPVLFSFLLAYLSYLLGKKLFKSHKAGLLLLFFNSFASSFGWIISFVKNRDFYGESTFWAMQSASNQSNPPYALSLIFILSGLLLLLNKPKSTLNYLLLFLLSLLIPITKAYAAFLWFPLLFLFSLKPTLKKSQKSLLFFFVTTISSYLVFSYYNSSSSSLFEFNPFWFVHTLIDSPDRLYLPKLSSYRFNLPSSIGPRLLIIEAFSLALFIIGNYALRLLALFKSKEIAKDTKLRNLSLVSIFLFLIPLFFTQKGNTWNSIQFIYYSLFLFNILLVNFLYQNKTKILLLVVIIITLIGNIGTYQSYFGNPAPASLPKSEVEALDFLKTQDKGVILSYPYDKEARKNFQKAPLPLYAYETTSYISAYTGFTSYLADEMNLEISNYDWQSRRKASLDFFKQESEFEDRGFLVNNQIDYIYLINSQYDQNTLRLTEMSLIPIYKNDKITVYKVNR